MSLITQRYATIISLSLSPVLDPAIAKVDNDETRREASKNIRLLPTSAQGYLELGAFFKQQANSHDALNVYKHGLRLVAQNDHQRTELKTRKDIMQNLLNHHTLRYCHLLPYDVWCLIFDNMGIKDLLKSACVCRSWCDFMIQWPKFWKLLAQVAPKINQSAVYALRYNKSSEFCLYGPMDVALLCYIILFLKSSCSSILGKLLFIKLRLTETDTTLLSNTLRLAGSRVQHVEFVDCIIPRHKVVRPILESCSSIPQISFSRSNITPRSYKVKKPCWYQLVIPSKHFTSLTYLKICIETTIFDRDSSNPIETGRLSAILRRCPNLVHLLLDSGGSVYHGHCIHQAIQYCPRLRTLAVSDKAEMPTTVTCAQINTIENYNQSDPSQGLQRLILSGGRIKIDGNDAASILKSTHSTLELLYLHYGGGCGAINPTLVFNLARFGVPSLREIRLSTESGADACDGHPPMTTALGALFCHCPLLEVITVEDTFSTGFNPLNGRLDVDDHVLNSIARHCPHLRYLKVIGRRSHTARGILNFAKARSHELTYLEIDMERTKILALVKILVKLETLRVRRSLLGHKDKISDNDKKTVQSILLRRNGAVYWT